MARLTLEEVTKRFGVDRPAVDRLSLDIEPGTFLALLGPSGCGKTTTLRMIAGFETPTAGTIALDDRVLAGGRRFVPPEDRNMAMVFQSHALWPHMSVAENVGYPLKVRGLSGATLRSRIDAALETVALSAFRDRRPADLSGGQRQRVALARCLVTDPHVILFDEPLASLDRHLKASLEQAFREFHRTTGATIVYVTHDQSEAMGLADRVAVMSDGHLVQLDAPKTIYQEPENAIVAALIGAGTVLDLWLPDEASRELGPAALNAALSGSLSGSPVKVLVRPEDIVQDGPNGIAFRVTDCVFRGERYALILEHAAGHQLTAWSRTPAAVGEIMHFTPMRGWRLNGEAHAVAAPEIARQKVEVNSSPGSTSRFFAMKAGSSG